MTIDCYPQLMLFCRSWCWCWRWRFILFLLCRLCYGFRYSSFDFGVLETLEAVEEVKNGILTTVADFVSCSVALVY